MKSIIKHISLLLVTIYTYSNYAFSEPIKKHIVFRDLSDSIINHKDDNNKLLDDTKKLKELLRNPETIFDENDLSGGITKIVYSIQAKTMDLCDHKISIITAIDIYLKELDARIDKNWNYDDERWKALDFHTQLKFEGRSVESIQDPIEKKKAIDQLDLEKKKMRKVNFKEKQQRMFISQRESILGRIADIATSISLEGVYWDKNDVLARFGINEECKLILMNHLERKGK
jgi:hypothetical protein